MLKKIWLNSVRVYLKLGLFFYFRRIRVEGKEHIKKQESTLILSNHQNALLDALLIASQLNHFAFFLTRAGVFQKQFVSKLLGTFNLLPIYRIRDGWNNLTNNNPVFERCISLLNEQQTVVIFPEGSHNLARRVRPLSKGFTRIVFGTLDNYPNLNLKLVPVGVNFISAKHFPDSAFINIGAPMVAKNYVFENRNESVIALRKDIHTQLTQLTTHIPEHNYEEIVAKLNLLNVDYLNPKAVNACIASKLKSCKRQPKSKLNGLRGVLKFVLILNILLPWLLWKFYVQPKIKEIEFTSTFRFAIAITLVPIYVIIVSTILASLYGMLVGIYYLLFSILLGLTTVKL